MYRVSNRSIETLVKVWENSKKLWKNTVMQKENQPVYFVHQNVNFFAFAIIMSTTCASSVFLLSYRNTVLNQSAKYLLLGYFLIRIIIIIKEA